MVLTLAAALAITTVGWTNEIYTTQVSMWAKDDAAADAIADQHKNDVLPWLIHDFYATQAPYRGEGFHTPTTEEFDAVRSAPAKIDPSRIPALIGPTGLALLSPYQPGTRLFNRWVTRYRTMAYEYVVPDGLPKAAYGSRAYSYVNNRFVLPLWKVNGGIPLDFIQYQIAQGQNVQGVAVDKAAIMLQVTQGLQPVEWDRAVPANVPEWQSMVSLVPPYLSAPFDTRVIGTRMEGDPVVVPAGVPDGR